MKFLKRFNENIDYYFNFIINNNYSPVDEELYSDIIEEGWSEEIDADIEDLEYLKLDLTFKDKKGLKEFNDDIIDKFNELDIKIKDTFENMIDLINYSTGEVYIVKKKIPTYELKCLTIFNENIENSKDKANVFSKIEKKLNIQNIQETWNENTLNKVKLYLTPDFHNDHIIISVKQKFKNEIKFFIEFLKNFTEISIYYKNDILAKVSSDIKIEKII